jgi:hypothetical protein
MHAQAWSTAVGSTLVFGGMTGSAASAVANDMWALHFGPDRRGKLAWRWTRLNDGKSGAPPARRAHGMAEIPSGTYAGKMLIYGGWGTNGEPLSDTWVYDPESNKYEELTSAGFPTPRVAFGMASSPSLNAVVIQGGQTNSSRENENFTQETWAFDGAAWVRVDTHATDPVGNRSGHDLVGTVGSVFLFDQPKGMGRQPTWVLNALK